MKYKKINHPPLILVTAGAHYLDIDAYACMVALAELLQLQGQDAIAWSAASCNYSVCPSLVAESQILSKLPEAWAEQGHYIIVDVSDPDYLQKTIPLDDVVAIFDHHVGFEHYWESRIGENARIEFLGAAATLIYREWKQAGLQDKMSRSAARLLIAAILDNTLNLTSANTTEEDVETFRALCAHAGVDEAWCAAYFSEVQASVETDLRHALQNDTKTVRDNPILPPKVAQLCVWDAERILRRLPEIRNWFEGSWMLNLIDLQHRCSWFICDTPQYQSKIGHLFGVPFEKGVAKLPTPWLRKEIIKKTIGG
jgi:inorganic pyrophosphatase/manganese-dependent inorganic pyrophosphatase